MYAMIDTINAAAALHGGTQITANTNPIPVGPAVFNLYWSSRDASRKGVVVSARALSFTYGFQYGDIKDNTIAVRCVRAF